ncbi:MAG: SxtJ family membrane protein [Vicinamibacterales bacterium]
MTSRRWTALGDVYVARPVAPSHRSFGLTVGGVLVVAAAFSAWRGHMLRAELLGAGGAGLVVAALAWPLSLAGLARGWGRVGHALGWINARVLLTIVFAVVFVPLGVVLRVFGSDPLDRRRRSGSFWSDYTARLRDPKHYERLF